jgi:hypothetical protein
MMSFDWFQSGLLWSDDEFEDEMREQEEENEEFFMFLLLGLHAYKSARERHEGAYLKYPHSSWRYLFLSDRSFLLVTGMKQGGVYGVVRHSGRRCVVVQNLGTRQAWNVTDVFRIKDEHEISTFGFWL